MPHPRKVMNIHVTSMREPYPGPDRLELATKVHRQGAFEVSSRKLPISKSGAIDDMSARVGIPIPEMIFGDNLVSVRHAPSGWAVAFEAEPALDRVEKTDRGMLRVAYAREWSRSREGSAGAAAAGIREVVKPFDWSYSTDYRGTETPGRSVPSGRAASPFDFDDVDDEEMGAATAAGGDEPVGGRGEERRLGTAVVGGGGGEEAKQIPLELLRRRDPILFFDEVVLYESELDDNGISIFSVKVRVMEQRMLLLARLYMRLDNVIVRVRDTRVYVDFTSQEVIREYTAKEDQFANVKRNLMMKGLLPDDVTTALRDSNQVAELLPVVEHQVDWVNLA